jgi:hypothetical protein
VWQGGGVGGGAGWYQKLTDMLQWRAQFRWGLEGRGAGAAGGQGNIRRGVQFRCVLWKGGGGGQGGIRSPLKEHTSAHQQHPRTRGVHPRWGEGERYATAALAAPTAAVCDQLNTPAAGLYAAKALGL